jgi:hypothetical protein
MFDLINKKATTTRALLFFVFILHLNTSFAQDTLSGNLNSKAGFTASNRTAFYSGYYFRMERTGRYVNYCR